MASIFDTPGYPTTGLCGPGPCGPAAPGGNEDVYLSPLSESVESAEFEVIEPAALVRGFDVPTGAVIRVEMVHGCGAGRIYGPYIKDGTPLAITASNTILSVPEAGRYRLVAEGVTLGDSMPTVVVNRRNGRTQALT